MKFQWLLVFGCLLLTACSDTPQENADADSGQAQEQTAPANENAAAEYKSAETDKAETVEPKSPEKEALAPADRYAAAQAKFDSEMKKFMTAFRALSEEERKPFIDENYPKPEKYADEFMKLAEEYPDSEVAFDSLYWVVSKVRSGEVADRAYEKMFADYIENESFKNVCMNLSYSQPSPLVESRLNMLIEKSPHDSVKASATFALASYLSRLGRTREMISEDSEIAEMYDEETVNYLNEREIEPMAIEALYQTLIADYPDLKPREGSKRDFKSMAESALFEINNLAIGMVAPEIEGDDLDGVSFKLSDYRGKVVVLDFWGDW